MALRDMLDRKIQEISKESRGVNARGKSTVKAVSITSEEIEPKYDYFRLGQRITGRNFDADLGIEVIQNWVRVKRELLNKHLVIIGKPGSGKTHALKRIIYEAANYSDVSIFFVEGKGDLSLCKDVINILYQAGKGKIPLVKMGYGDDEHTSTSVYNCFRGSSLEIYNRFLILIGVAEMIGDSSFYADQYRNLLQLICGVNKPQIDPPRDFEDLWVRLDIAWLNKAYADDPMERLTLDNLENDTRIIPGLQSRLQPYSRELMPYIDGSGFALEDVKGAVFSVRSGAVADSAKRLLTIIVEDYKSYMGFRQKGPALLVIDEFGAFDNRNIEQLMTMGRQYETGVILGTQDVATIKDEYLRQIILASAVTKVLLASDYPEEMVKLAGTKKVPEMSIQIKSNGEQGDASSRDQHTFVIDPNKAAKQKPGEAFIFRDRHAIQLKFKMVDDIQHDPNAIAEYKKPKKQIIRKQPQAPKVDQKSAEPTTGALPKEVEPPVKAPNFLINKK